jgi:protein-tyrosine phosphatase
VIKRFKQLLLRGEPESLPDNPAATRVLMVCMGNICRSPTAEAVLRAKLQRAGLHGRVLVDSAGTHGYHTNEQPDPRAQAHAARRGYDLTALRARPVAADDFARFKWILAMDDANLAWLQEKAPEGSRAHLGLLLEQAAGPLPLREVRDPYYGAAAGFDHVLDLVEHACDGLVATLLKNQRGEEGTS